MKDDVVRRIDVFDTLMNKFERNYNIPPTMFKEIVTHIVENIPSAGDTDEQQAKRQKGRT